MEVPRIKPEETDSKWKTIHDFCYPCDTKDQLVPAVGFCPECTHKLCQKCYDGHTIPLSTRNHRPHLYFPTTGAQVSPASSTKPKTKSTFTCHNHPAKAVEVYCITHDSAVCAMCIHKHHKSCDTEDLTSVTDDFYQSNDYFQLKDILINYNTTIDLIYSDANTNITVTEQSNDDALKELDIVTNKIIDHFKQIKNNMITAGKQDKDTDVNSLKDIKAECQVLKSQVTQQQAELHRHEENSINLYVTSMHALKLAETLRAKIESISLRNHPVSYRFKPDDFIQTITTAARCLGTITSTNIPPPIPPRQPTQLRQDISQRPLKQKHETHCSNTSRISANLVSAKVTKMADINVKSSQDMKKCFITGMTILSSSKLLLADYNNQCVKCINTRTNTIESYLTLFGQPHDMTILPDNPAAVTLPYTQNIQILSTSGPLSPVNKLSVKGRCEGITSTKDKLIVSYVPLIFNGLYMMEENDTARVDIMDLQGHVLHTIQYDQHGELLDQCPWYVAVSDEKDREVIYASDKESSTVTKLSMSGQVLFTYAHQDKLYPCKITLTNDEHVLVCCRGTHQVHLVSPSGKKMKTLLSRTDGLKEPTEICANSEQNMIYISNYEEDSLKVYKIE